MEGGWRANAIPDTGEWRSRAVPDVGISIDAPAPPDVGTPPPAATPPSNWRSRAIPDQPQPVVAPPPTLPSSPASEPYQGSILPFSTDASGQSHFDINAGLPGAVISAFKAP